MTTLRGAILFGAMPMAIVAMLGSAGCAIAAPPTPRGAAGWVVYRASHIHQDLYCDGRPVVLAGSHTLIRLAGDCPLVRVAGDHNDVFVRIAPGGLIEITGAHNDVTWSSARGGLGPQLVKRGRRNTFHFASR